MHKILSNKNRFSYLQKTFHFLNDKRICHSFSMYVIFTIPWGQITQFCKNNTQPKSSSFSRSGTFPAKFPYSIYTCFGGSTALMISAIHEKKMLRTTHAATLRFLLCAILIFPIRQMIQMIAPTIVAIITVLLLCLLRTLRSQVP